MGSKRSYARKERVGKQLLQIVAKLLISDVKDPSVKDVQVTDADVSPDMRHAKIYWIPLGEPEDLEAIQSGLDRVAGFLRRAVADQLETKYTPELRFIYDETIEHARRIDDLLAGISTDEDEETEEDDG